MNQTHSPLPSSAAVRDVPAGPPGMPQASTATPWPRGGPPRVAVVASSWHREIVQCAVTALADGLARAAAPPALDRFEVPGAFEIPLHAQRLARSGRYDAIVACGLVVNGGIYRHEFVAAAVVDGLMRVQLDTGVPVFSAVLTPRDFHDHDEHRRFFATHFVTKGGEAAQACLQTLAALANLPAAAAAWPPR